MIDYDTRNFHRERVPQAHPLRPILGLVDGVRHENMLMEQVDYHLLFRWFVGLNMDHPVRGVSVFTKTWQRLLEGVIVEAFFDEVLVRARAPQLLSNEHFTVVRCTEAGQGRRPHDRAGR